MPNVIIEGWYDQRNPKPVSLVDAMRRQGGITLPVAKKLLDSFAEQGWVIVQLQTVEQALALVEDAAAIGAVARVVENGS